MVLYLNNNLLIPGAPQEYKAAFHLVCFVPERGQMAGCKS